MIKQTDNGAVVFVHPPRCSGTSIEQSLVGIVADSNKHFTASMIRQELSKNIFSDRWGSAFKFGIVRNPFDRMASLYVTKEPPFSGYNLNAGYSMIDFLDRFRVMPWEYGLTCDDYMNEQLDYIIKFEDRENGIAVVNKELERFGLKIDPKVKTRSHYYKNKNFMSYYDPESIRIIELAFAADFERWYND